MYRTKTILGLIPAREGSRRLPKKNVLPFMGKPLILWTIKQALSSAHLDRVIVSTDSVKIAAISRRYGAEVPFIRPKNLAGDRAAMIDVLLHAIKSAQEKNENYDLIMLLQPTSPLRIGQDIDRAIKLLFRKKAQAIVSVCKAEHPPYWSRILPKRGSMKNFINVDIPNKNKRVAPCYYRLNGAVYLAYCDYLKANKSFLGKKTYAYVMPQERSIDIDTKMDFKLAELLGKSKF